MQMPVDHESADAADGAIDLMTKLAVLIVATLLFAGYGIRDGRTQGLQTHGAQAAAQAKPERAAMQRRQPIERRSTPSPRAAAPIEHD